MLKTGQWCQPRLTLKLSGSLHSYGGLGLLHKCCGLIGFGCKLDIRDSVCILRNSEESCKCSIIFFNTQLAINLLI